MNRPLFVLLAGVALGGALNRSASAQVMPQVAPATAPANTLPSIHVVPLKNVSASLMAYWLDPKNHQRPRELGVEKAQLAPDTTGAFALPAGIEQLVAIDAQKALLVFGTDAGAQELAKTIAFLDQKQRSVEIEVNWVEVQPEAARAFGIDYSGGGFSGVSAGFASPPIQKSGPQIGTVRGTFVATLTALVGQNRAKILASPRLTIFNNRAGEVNVFVASLGEVRFQSDNQSLAPFFQGTTQFGLEYGLDVTPTINNDDTVTVSLTTSSKLKIKTANGVELLGAEPLTGLQSIVNVRDGGTIALAGLSSRGASAAKDAKPSSNLIIFVTARIVRRADEGVTPAAK